LQLVHHKLQKAEVFDYSSNHWQFLQLTFAVKTILRWFLGAFRDLLDIFKEIFAAWERPLVRSQLGVAQFPQALRVLL
jgi:hypothetical protein